MNTRLHGYNAAVGLSDESSLCRNGIMSRLPCLVGDHVFHLYSTTCVPYVAVSPDPVDEFLEHTAKSRVIIPFKRKLSDSLEKKSDSSREESNDNRIKDLVCDNESDCETENLSEPVTSTSGSDQLQLDKTGSDEPQPSTSQQNTDSATASPVDLNNTDNSSLNSGETLEECEPPSKRRKTEKKGKSGNMSTSSTATNSSSSSSSETTVKEETLIKDEIKRKVTCGE